MYDILHVTVIKGIGNGYFSIFKYNFKELSFHHANLDCNPDYLTQISNVIRKFPPTTKFQVFIHAYAKYKALWNNIKYPTLLMERGCLVIRDDLSSGIFHLKKTLIKQQPVIRENLFLFYYFLYCFYFFWIFLLFVSSGYFLFNSHLKKDS